MELQIILQYLSSFSSLVAADLIQCCPIVSMVRLSILSASSSASSLFISQTLVEMSFSQPPRNFLAFFSACSFDFSSYFCVIQYLTQAQMLDMSLAYFCLSCSAADSAFFPAPTTLFLKSALMCFRAYSQSCRYFSYSQGAIQPFQASIRSRTLCLLGRETAVQYSKLCCSGSVKESIGQSMTSEQSMFNIYLSIMASILSCDLEGSSFSGTFLALSRFNFRAELFNNSLYSSLSLAFSSSSFSCSSASITWTSSWFSSSSSSGISNSTMCSGFLRFLNKLLTLPWSSSHSLCAGVLTLSLTSLSTDLILLGSLCSISIFLRQLSASSPSSSSAWSSPIGVMLRWLSEQLTLADSMILFSGVMPKGVLLLMTEFRGVVMLNLFMSSRSFQLSWGSGNWMGMATGFQNLLFIANIALQSVSLSLLSRFLSIFLCSYSSTSRLLPQRVCREIVEAKKVLLAVVFSSTPQTNSGTSLLKGISLLQSMSCFWRILLISFAVGMLSTPAISNYLSFCSWASLLASSMIFSRYFLFAFLPLVLANLTLTSANISFSSSSISIGSSLAGFVSGLGSIYPGLSLLRSSVSWPDLPWAKSNSFSYLSKHWVGVLPTKGAIVLHWEGKTRANCSSFSSSARLHSVFLMLGSSHSYHLCLHCLADLRCRRDDIRDHWFSPYFIIAAFRISSSEFFQTPPFMIYLISFKIQIQTAILQTQHN